MSDLSSEVAALREAVDNLANRAELQPRYREPDAAWIDRPGSDRLHEWKAVRSCYDDSRSEWRVRSGYSDGIASIYLVDRYGDMHALSVSDTYRLIEALSAAALHVADDLTARRVKKQAGT